MDAHVLLAHDPRLDTETKVTYFDIDCLLCWFLDITKDNCGLLWDYGVNGIDRKRLAIADVMVVIVSTW